MKLLYLAMGIVSVLIAAALMTFLAEKSSVLAFIGWAIFFAVFFGPVLFFGRNSRFACRLFGRS